MADSKEKKVLLDVQIKATDALKGLATYPLCFRVVLYDAKTNGVAFKLCHRQ